jgi:hypothetical protein
MVSRLPDGNENLSKPAVPKRGQQRLGNKKGPSQGLLGFHPE